MAKPCAKLAVFLATAYHFEPLARFGWVMPNVSTVPPAEMSSSSAPPVHVFREPPSMA